MTTDNQPIPEWEADLDPCDPDNYWIDQATGERVNAVTNERSAHDCPADYDHIFRTMFGMPPSKNDNPLCGANLPDSWDWAGPRPTCPTCQRLAEQS